MLMTDTPDGRYPYAGIPWYSTTFGRDGLITAIQMLWCDPTVARGVLRRLAAHQSSKSDPVSDAQPGKILHEMRSGEMAVLGEVPFALYYGSVDATPLFVLLAGLYAERTGDLETLRSLWPAVEAGLAWIDHHGDIDHDGFVEYFRASETGLVNQGWKDSFDAVFHADGTLATGPIALAEVQGYVYAAKSTLARCARRLNRMDQASQLEQEARLLADKFDRDFWCDDLGMYALALDGNKRPCRVATSNMGQLLFSGIARRDRAHSIAAALMQKRFFSGWGIRTVARRRVALQSDVLSQRLDLAARQRPDRARARPLRLHSRRSSRCSRACSMRRRTWTCGACQSCSAAFAAGPIAARRCIRSPARRRPGRVPRRSRWLRPRSGSNSIRYAARSGCATRGCLRFSTK